MSSEPFKKPNFFLLGAGRSGSTYLWGLLKQHPDIFMTTPKEPTYFCETFQVIKNPIDYYKLFEQAKDKTIRGEASHVYLSNPGTAPVLGTLFPQAKFVSILRNPAERAHSLFSWMHKRGFEDIDKFEAALAAEDERYQSDAFKSECRQYFYNYMYFRSGLYGQQFDRYFDLFPREQFHIIELDAFKAKPRRHLKRIFKFLDVDPDFQPKLNIWKNSVKTTSVLTSSTKEELLNRYISDMKRLNETTGISFGL